ncbi:MAG TPA: adenylate/guanylate cyclase domain-containing protein [Anaerolineales bacterium]|nr:adenylate/guanylate cyclase domain-containing protein [Anaerolineales bacterium]
MNCPNCGFDNNSDARFCENCGQPLERACPNCGQAVSAGARFCRHCGFDQTTGAAPATRVPRSGSLDALRRAAPSAIADKILAGRERMEGERKRVTALFTDIVGSTALAEGMDPEDWREIVTGAHQRVSDAVYRYEGTIAQLLGDGVLAFFGAPLAHEDDPERAVRAGWQILSSIQEYAKELASNGRVASFQMRVGLNTGLVVVGNIGSDLHMEYLAIGDTVNLAARVQSVAEPDTMLVTENTFRLTSSLFDFEDRGLVSVKGKAEAVHIYRVLGERRGAVRTRGIAGLSAPMVGRERELAILMHTLEDLKAGRGSTVAIIGEAGLGKTRLIAEWRQASAELFPQGGLLWVEGRCLSYGASMAHHLSTEILRGLIGASPESAPEEVEAALRGTLQRTLSDDWMEAYPFLAHLLGLTLEEEASSRVKYLDGPALQAKYIAAYRRLLHGLCQAAPTVIVCEDVHWADPSSAELGRQVLPVVTETPLVIVFAARPDRESTGWRLLSAARDLAGGGAVELHLTPLSEADSQELVRSLLDIESLPESVRTLILEKAEGNPFFVEEVIRMLIDQAVIGRQGEEWVLAKPLGTFEIPDTLQGVLAARIDRLPEDAKRALQVASVIGRKFQVRVLEEVLRRRGA